MQRGGVKNGKARGEELQGTSEGWSSALGPGAEADREGRLSIGIAATGGEHRQEEGDKDGSIDEPSGQAREDERRREESTNGAKSSS